MKSYVCRVPTLFLLIGGLIAVFSIIGLICIKESDSDTSQHKDSHQSQTVEELPSLKPQEVLKTGLFYKVPLKMSLLRL